MKRSKFTWMAVGLLLVALGVWWSLSDQENPNSDLPGKERAQKPIRQQNTLTNSPNAGHSEKESTSEDPSVVPDGAKTLLVSEILEEIHDASVTYDPKQLIKIEPYLLHPDPEVRKAAINGMIVLGDASAGALMRAAATKAPSPHDAVALLEAADYVELPSATGFIRKTKPGDGSRGPGVRDRFKNMKPRQQSENDQ